MPTAVGEYVCVRVVQGEDEDKTESGIIVAKSDRQRDGDVVWLKQGVFLSRGDQVKQRFKKDQVLLFTPLDANFMIKGKEEYAILHEKYIKGTL